jgi:hypothetical protein
MATYPPKDGSRCLSIDLTVELVNHLDTQAAYYGCSRVAYLRRLVIDDMAMRAAYHVARNAG